MTSSDTVARRRSAAAHEADALRASVGRLYRQIRVHAGGELTPSQAATLVRLERDGPMRLGALALAEGMSASTASRIVSSLESLGFLERVADASDGRASVLSVSDRGSRVLGERRARASDAVAEMVERLSGSERRALRDALPVLDKLADLLVVYAPSPHL